MYQIIKSGISLGFVSSPTYIMLLDNGYCGLCSEEEATGIVYNGAVFNLMGKTLNPNSEEPIETVLLVECDSGIVVSEHGEQLQSVSDAMCEQDTANDERISVLEDALCDMDTLINGGASNE